MRISNYVSCCVLLVFTIFNQFSCGYKILGVFPHGGKSHFFVFVPIMRELARRGHEVTVISHFPEKTPLPNYTDISLVGAGHIGLNNLPVTMIKESAFKSIYEHLMLSQKGKDNCEGLNLPEIQNLIKSNRTFDVIIHEHFNSDCFLALNYIFKAPHIGVSSCTPMPWTVNRFGIPANPAYIPVNLLQYSHYMTFFERVFNTLNYFLHTYIMSEFCITRPANSAIKKYIGDNIPAVEEIAKNTSLFLVNTHYSLNKARPFPPNVIEIAGVHLEKPKPLPADLEKFITESKHGVIYFSFGSMLLGSTLTDDVKQAFMEAFKELPQRVLWKYENESLPGKPDNVMIKKWMPQSDILSHPNVVAFISHCGLLGTIEGVHNGKSIVSIPFFGDQYVNAKVLESYGTSITLNCHKLNKEAISKALNFVLQPSIQEKAKRLARIFRDRPVSPMETALWWIEYIARNGAVHEMQPAVVQMPFYQSALLDVGAFLLVVILIIFYINYKLVKLILNKLFSKKKVKKE